MAPNRAADRNTGGATTPAATPPAAAPINRLEALSESDADTEDAREDGSGDGMCEYGMEVELSVPLVPPKPLVAALLDVGRKMFGSDIERPEGLAVLDGFTSRSASTKLLEAATSMVEPGAPPRALLSPAPTAPAPTAVLDDGAEPPKRSTVCVVLMQRSSAVMSARSSAWLRMARPRTPSGTAEALGKLRIQSAQPDQRFWITFNTDTMAPGENVRSNVSQSTHGGLPSTMVDTASF
jgi:hypothetical protein